jgi:Tol biopolymer transport system component/DNA-binding winged helix-turn-helix (wHTH) protein
VQGDFRIGEWLIHPRVNAIEQDGEMVHLEPKVMQVLVTLAAVPGEVVTREQLRSAVWPDVFVGDDVLIRAISEIRRAFSDDPREPRVIQTVPKVGYRLISVVTQIAEEPAEASGTLPDVNQQPAPEAAPSVESSPAEREVRSQLFRPTLLALTAVALALVAAAVWWGLTRRGHETAARKAAYTSRPLTTYPGSQLQPNISPDGTAVAFVWLKENESAGHIYVKMLGSEAPVRLTSGTAQELSPAWSPDGRWIAFMRHDAARTSVVIVPAIGGSEQEIYSLATNHVWEYGGLTWTPDGSALVFPQQANSQAPSALVELNIKGRTVRALTNPPNGWDGDWTPQFSPDGTKLAFVRGSEGSVYDLYILMLPNGEPRRITTDGRLIDGLTWSADGSSIIYASNRSGSISLWRVSAQGGTPEHESAGGDNAASPSIARQSNRLVYSRGNAIWSIVATTLDHAERGTADEILSSSEQDASPHVSPAGDRIVFQSWRSGSQEIWSAKTDGSDPIQLTSLNASAGSPYWSHDGRRIVFDARVESFAHIYVMNAEGGEAHPLTSGNYNDIVPSWSVDDRWIFFGSNRSGTWQVWKVPADGSGAPQQVTTEGGMVAVESEDGNWLYLTHYAEAGLWKCPANGGPQRRIFDGPPAGNLNYWTVGNDALYSLAQRGTQYTVERIDPATGRSQTVYTLKHSPTPFAGLSLTPDGKRLIFAELNQASSGLTLVDHFE